MAWNFNAQEALITIFSDAFRMKDQLRCGITQTVAHLKQQIHQNWFRLHYFIYHFLSLLPNTKYPKTQSSRWKFTTTIRICIGI